MTKLPFFFLNAGCTEQKLYLALICIKRLALPACELSPPYAESREGKISKENT